MLVLSIQFDLGICFPTIMAISSRTVSRFGSEAKKVLHNLQLLEPSVKHFYYLLVLHIFVASVLLSDCKLMARLYWLYTQICV